MIRRRFYSSYKSPQALITDYDKVEGSNDFGFLKPERDSYKGTPYLPDDVSSWTNGALSDWNGKSKGTGWLPSSRASPVLPGLSRPPTASHSFWLPSGFILKFSYLWDKKIIMLDILHKLKIFFCDYDVEKIVVNFIENHRNN